MLIRYTGIYKHYIVIVISTCIITLLTQISNSKYFRDSFYSAFNFIFLELVSVRIRYVANIKNSGFSHSYIIIIVLFIRAFHVWILD